MAILLRHSLKLKKIFILFLGLFLLITHAPHYLLSKKQPKVNAAFVVLCRNSDIQGIEKSITKLEQQFNKRFNYPYVFLNDQPFTTEFINRINALNLSKKEFHKVDSSAWGYPTWINQTYASECRSRSHFSYGDSEPYRHMCRYYSGFFFRHPSVTKYEYYWRVEPNVNFFCDIQQDPFLYMKQNKKLYGYVMAINEEPATIPSLFKTVKKWAILKKIEQAPLFDYFTNDDKQYNQCHFWSNFEIAKVSLWNNPLYLDFFEYLDKTGGFFYERWGDAPVHSLYIGLTLCKDQIHFFENIGYEHDGWHQCSDRGYLKELCSCPAWAPVGTNANSCLQKLLNYNETKTLFLDQIDNE